MDQLAGTTDRTVVLLVFQSLVIIRRRYKKERLELVVIDLFLIKLPLNSKKTHGWK